MVMSDIAMPGLESGNISLQAAAALRLTWSVASAKCLQAAHAGAILTPSTES